MKVLLIVLAGTVEFATNVDPWYSFKSIESIGVAADETFAQAKDI